MPRNASIFSAPWGSNGDKVKIQVEEALGVKERCERPVPVQELREHMETAREAYSFLTDQEWQQAVSIDDKDGQSVDLEQMSLRAERFPVSVQLPKQRQMFASLFQKQAQLAEEQAALKSLTGQVLTHCGNQSRFGDFCKNAHDAMLKSIQKEISNIKDDLQADRTVRDHQHASVLEAMNGLRSFQEKEASATAETTGEIRALCKENDQHIKEIPNSVEQLRQLGDVLVPSIIRETAGISTQVQDILANLKVVPEILEKIQRSEEHMEQMAQGLVALPNVCKDIDSKCDAAQRGLSELKSLPTMMQDTQGTCESILRMEVDLKPVLSLLQDSKGMIAHMQSRVTSLESVQATCRGSTITCEAVLQQLASDLAPLPSILQDTRGTCDRIHERVSDAIPAELKTLQQQAGAIKEEGQMQHMNLVDRLGAIGIAVSKSQPLTVDQYVALTNTLQQTLEEMQNPIPQPKMSFANAVVHVHKSKKHDDTIIEKFSSPKGRPGAFQLANLVNHSSELEVLPFGSCAGGFSGRIKTPNSHQSTQKKSGSTSARGREVYSR